MEASRRTGGIWRLPSEEGQGDLSRPIAGNEDQPVSRLTVTGEALESDPTCAGLDVHDPRRARQGDVARRP